MSTSTTKDVQASSTPSFVSALVVAAITVGVCVVFWFVFFGRKQFQRVYQPRTLLAPLDKRAEPLPSQPHAWWKRVFTLNDDEILHLNGPDAYFFVRFIRIFGLYAMVPYILLSFAVCVPASTVKPTNGKTGLNIITFGNAYDGQPNRRLAHFFVAVILILWTLYLLWREYNHFMEVRLNWLRASAATTKSRTIALVNVPESHFSEAGLKEIGGTIAGFTGRGNSEPAGSASVAGASNIDHVWLARNVKSIEKVYDARDKEVYRLEGGVGKLLKKAQKNQLKKKTPEAKGTWNAEDSNLPDRYVLPKKQPTWKQGLLGLIGKKMDLKTSPLFIAEKNAELAKERENIERLKEGNVAFVRFDTQSNAHNYARFICKSDKSLRMVQPKIELVPEDIVWGNTSMSWYQRKARTAASWAATIALIIFWSIPVAFVGIVSNVDSLCDEAPFLAWICDLPSPALGIIKGVLPPALMALLFMLLPIVLRIWIRLQGEIRKSEIELKLFTRYWLFWVIQGFLVVTFASGLTSALKDIGGTASNIPTQLATNLPDASIYFLTYILVNSWGAAAKAFARISPWVMYNLRGFLAGGTPRKAYQQKYKMDSFNWAETMPTICILVCVTIVYSVIQPLITVIAVVGFLIFYASYKYLLIWCASQPEEMETGGLYYIKALRTVFVSLYLEVVCLAGLFFLSSKPDGGRTANGIACGIILVLVGVIVAVTQAWFDHVRFKRNDIIFGVRGNNVVSSSQVQLTEKDRQLSHDDEVALERQFDHPALWKKQPCVWIADDPLGVGRYEAERINADGVEASTQYAHMNEKGQLAVDRSPPDEDWDPTAWDDHEN